MSAERRVAIIGAGALGLGFIGPELAQDAEVCFLDVEAKADMLGQIERDRAYAINLAGTDIRTVRVNNVRAMSGGTDAERAEVLAQADLCFTAVGQANFPSIARMLTHAANLRPAGTPLVVLCAENGQDVSRELARHMGEVHAIITDTVMGRMCRWLDRPEGEYRPLVGAAGPAVVAEEFYGIPYRRLPGMADLGFPALQSRGAPEFALDEHVKLFGHNCVHGLIAYAAARRGCTHLHEVANDPRITARAERLLCDELKPALRFHHATFDAKAFSDYASRLPRRILSIAFADTVERGIRGTVAKLRPSERWISAIRFVRAAGIRPQSYLHALGDLLRVSGLLEKKPLGEVLVEHCGLDPAEISELRPIIESSINSGDASWT